MPRTHTTQNDPLATSAERLPHTYRKSTSTRLYLDNPRSVSRQPPARPLHGGDGGAIPPAPRETATVAPWKGANPCDPQTMLSLARILRRKAIHGKGIATPMIWTWMQVSVAAVDGNVSTLTPIGGSVWRSGKSNAKANSRRPSEAIESMSRCGPRASRRSVDRDHIVDCHGATGRPWRTGHRESRLLARHCRECRRAARRFGQMEN